MTTRVPADGTVTVRLTVNGSPVTLDVPPRLTLADALRERLHLTGTHLGCEHGVCGMCTVVVDGDAARACLLFACQLDGAEVLTVEGLGTPDDLHPLQAAFGHHHGLQCGFCTPGFLMSSYSLLRDRPDVTRDELPEELSGVLCRCTGYRGIVAAVEDVADAHRDGLPGPGNCGRALVATQPPHGSTSHSEPASGQPDGSLWQEITVPTGAPTVTVEVARDLGASPDDVWRVVTDIETLAACLPGAELTERVDDHRATGRARVSVGPVRLSFRGAAEIVEARDRRLHARAQGRDVGGARTQADIRLVIETTADGTRLAATADVHLTGRIAQFGRALAGDVSTRMFEQFCDAVEQTAAGRAPTPRQAPNALALLAATLAARARDALQRWRSR